jgi:hypothetical protein
MNEWAKGMDMVAEFSIHTNEDVISTVDRLVRTVLRTICRKGRLTRGVNMSIQFDEESQSMVVPLISRIMTTRSSGQAR